MGRIAKKIKDAISYCRLRRRMDALAPSHQRAVSQRIYAEAYDVMKLSQGNEVGACAVVFSCPYPGHVAYRVENMLAERVKDPKDPALMADVEALGDDKWVACALVRAASAQDAITAADACVMSAVLASSTVSPSFAKYLTSVDGELLDGRTSEEVLAQIKRDMLGDSVV